MPTVTVPSGDFLMGSSQGRPDEQPVRRVHVAGFRIGQTPITNEQYRPFLGCGRVEAPPWWDSPAFSAPDQPVVGITWYDAIAYTAWLGERLSGRWRLPTEAEWERATRGGLESAPTPWGERLPEGEVPGGPLAGPWPVGRGTPNGFGLLDPGTVVHEWCLDAYRAGLASPRHGEAVERRSSRGGSWRHRVRWSAPSARSSLPPGLRYADYGFRVVRENE
jgi:formylglycine-generating enzyme required for sulfatase activity